MQSIISQNLQNLRTIQPLVHNITNQVVMNSTANALLAIGASPIMAHAPEEVSDMVALSGSLVINTGTITSAMLSSMTEATDAARIHNKSWILDPVGAGATSFRLSANKQLLEQKPTVVRGNASEIKALFTGEAGGKGVDSDSSSQSTLSFIKQAASAHQLIIAVTGETDLITDGSTVIALNNGCPMMAKVTGTGCTATALIGAFLATCNSSFDATVSALGCLGIAGELAGRECPGPGSLQLRLLDQLYMLNEETITRYLKLNIQAESL